MFARVTPYKMKPGTREEATALLNEIKSEIMGLPGMQSFVNVANEDGSGYVISIVTDQATSDANGPAVQAIWGKFAGFLEEMPTPAGYDVMAHWSN